MLEQFCGALNPANRASIQLSTAGAHGTRLVVWLSASYCWYCTCTPRPQYSRARLRHVASDHDAVAGTDARCAAGRSLEQAVGALADEQRNRRVPSAPMISWFTAWT